MTLGLQASSKITTVIQMIKNTMINDGVQVHRIHIVYVRGRESKDEKNGAIRKKVK